MKRFILTIVIFIAIPLVLLVGIYLWTDPFRCLHEFDINDVDATNREYLSTELFLRNEPTYHYNSFVFSSSRGGAMNTYQWKQYLPDGAQPFLFQAWSETVTGIELKLAYLNENKIPIKNALILLDIPSSFSGAQLPRQALSMKHYLFTGQSKFGYNAVQFWNFIQKPSIWIKNIKNTRNGLHSPCSTDTITNDWNVQNQFNYTDLPAQDSLNNCSEIARQTFMAKWEGAEGKVQVSKPLIDARFEQQFRRIKAIFDDSQTDYYVIITPAPCYTNAVIHPDDLAILQSVFGNERVRDYSGKREWTEDVNNFSDPNHFGARVGYMIIEDIYKR